MMRQEAKMGLAAMEAMGQMGNSEEATIPDDLPFDICDLDIEDDKEYNMAQGGVVKMQQLVQHPTTINRRLYSTTTSNYRFLRPTACTTIPIRAKPVSGSRCWRGCVTPRTAVDPVVPTFSTLWVKLFGC